MHAGYSKYLTRYINYLSAQYLPKTLKYNVTRGRCMVGKIGIEYFKGNRKKMPIFRKPFITLARLIPAEG